MASIRPYSHSPRTSDASDKAGNAALVPDKTSLDDDVLSQQSEPMVVSKECIIGCLDVHIHHARDIQNICIYHKQDVYAKISLSSDPETTVSTKTINGGGRNPVFNESLRLNVHTTESSLRCEIWMLSRVRNYLEDQLLGFTLVPLVDVVASDGKLTQEFQLSSTDLFHSPSGFVQLSLEYVGSSPEVVAIRAPPLSETAKATISDTKNVDHIASEFVKLEFPDMKVVTENKMMVSEYTGIPCEKLENECNESLISPENDDHAYREAAVSIVENFSAGNGNADGNMKKESPPSSASVNGSLATVSTNSQPMSESSVACESQEPSVKTDETEDREADYSDGQACSAFDPSLINVNIPEQPVVQQDIVNMYMKSMQQFTESLAKMRLPMDAKSNDTTNVEAAKKPGPEEKDESKGTGARVFYGSRAFF